jgi:hypothetical protein
MNSMSEPKLDTVAKPSVTDAYVSEEERVLDPTVLDKSLVERMPDPSGWRLLVLPYKGKGITDGGPLAYKDDTKFEGIPWCKKGDWVLIGRYAGARFALEDDHEVRIINDDEVIGTILNPDDIKSA